MEGREGVNEGHPWRHGHSDNESNGRVSPQRYRPALYPSRSPHHPHTAPAAPEDGEEAGTVPSRYGSVGRGGTRKPSRGNGRSPAVLPGTRRSSFETYDVPLSDQYPDEDQGRRGGTARTRSPSWRRLQQPPQEARMTAMKAAAAYEEDSYADHSVSDGGYHTASTQRRRRSMPVRYSGRASTGTGTSASPPFPPQPAPGSGPPSAPWRASLRASAAPSVTETSPRLSVYERKRMELASTRPRWRN